MTLSVGDTVLTLPPFGGPRGRGIERPEAQEMAVPAALPATDACLVRGAPVIDQWYEQYSGELIRFIRSKGFTPEDAEDICGAAFLEAVRYQPADIAPRAWLYLVVRNRMVEAWRRAARRRVVSLEPWHDVAVEMSELQEPIPLDCLTREQRIVIEARYLKDWTIAETSAALGLSPSSVKARQHRAMMALRTEIEKSEQSLSPQKPGAIAPHWYGDEAPAAEPESPTQVEVPVTLSCPPMPDQLCANGDGRLAYVRLRRRALCASCGLLWLSVEVCDA